METSNQPKEEAGEAVRISSEVSEMSAIDRLLAAFPYVTDSAPQKEPKTHHTLTQLKKTPGEEQDLESIYFEPLWGFVMNPCIDSTPIVNDMTARTINRLGGWETVKRKWNTIGFTKVRARQDFMIEFRELLPLKQRGFYESDQTPYLEGPDGRVYAFREPLPAVVQEVEP